MKKRSIQKRIRNNDILPHPQLTLMRSGMWGYMVKFHIAFYLILAFTQRYWAFLASFDVMVVLAFLGYQLVWKRLVRQQSIPAFYRYEYDALHQIGGMIIVSGAFLRTTMLTAYYVFCLVWVSGDATHERWEHYWREGFDNLSSGMGWFFGLLVSAFMLYHMFYRKKFISIVEFSSLTSQFMIRQKCHYEYAATYVLKTRHDQQEPKTRTAKPYSVEQLIADTFGDTQPRPQQDPPAGKGQRAADPLIRRRARETETSYVTQPVRRRERK